MREKCQHETIRISSSGTMRIVPIDDLEMGRILREWKAIIVERIPLMNQDDIQELMRVMSEIYTAIWHDSCHKEREGIERERRVEE